MEFKRPFDPRQRALAARLYNRYRSDLKAFHAKYPPATVEERRLFRRFHDLAQNFAREAALPDAKVNVARLNRLAVAADEAEMNYQIVRRLRMLDED